MNQQTESVVDRFNSLSQKDQVVFMQHVFAASYRIDVTVNPHLTDEIDGSGDTCVSLLHDLDGIDVAIFDGSEAEECATTTAVQTAFLCARQHVDSLEKRISMLEGDFATLRDTS